MIEHLINLITGLFVGWYAYKAGYRDALKDFPPSEQAGKSGPYDADVSWPHG